MSNMIEPKLFIEGINFLSATHHSELKHFIIFELLLFITAILFVSFINYLISEDNWFIIAILFFLTSALVIISILYYKYGEREDYYTYKVTIDENVNFVEFDDKYEILSKDGMIYEIKERETILEKEK